jgi:hypothetical protein
VEIPEGAWSQRVGEGRLWTTWDLMVRRTGEPTAVRRGTLLLPDCAVMTSPGLRAFSSVSRWLWTPRMWPGPAPAGICRLRAQRGRSRV